MITSLSRIYPSCNTFEMSSFMEEDLRRSKLAFYNIASDIFMNETRRAIHHRLEKRSNFRTAARSPVKQQDARFTTWRLDETNGTFTRNTRIRRPS